MMMVMMMIIGSYTVDSRSGSIRWIDHTDGCKVQLMICDVSSYIKAMLFMKAFHPINTLITYWDEPTIAMDYEVDPLHDIIHRMWKENIVPRLILSSATLPSVAQLNMVASDFMDRFGSNTEVHEIHSFDCKKSIVLLNTQGYPVVPHTIPSCSSWEVMRQYVQRCLNNKTMLRYLDLESVLLFINTLHQQGWIRHLGRSLRLEHFVGSVQDLSMQRIKEYYLTLLHGINEELWNTTIYPLFQQDPYHGSNRFQSTPSTTSLSLAAASSSPLTKWKSTSSDRERARATIDGQPLRRLQSTPVLSESHGHGHGSFVTGGVPLSTKPSNGTLLTTRDAHTLTDGPTIYLTRNIRRLADFFIQQAEIPEMVMSKLRANIEFNHELLEQIDGLEKAMALEQEKVEAKLAGSCSDESFFSSSSSAKSSRSNEKIAASKIDKRIAMAEKTGKNANWHTSQYMERIQSLRRRVKPIFMDDVYVPNKKAHLAKWAPPHAIVSNHAFTSQIDESTVTSILLLQDVDDNWKILLLMGIGVFTEHRSIAYVELMKQLALNQHLFLVIADTDFIYGTNYQYCHGYIGKDLSDGLTQEKLMQALGRVGRGNIQQSYTVRFRDDQLIDLLFAIPEEDGIEVRNMNRLFRSYDEPSLYPSKS